MVFHLTFQGSYKCLFNESGHLSLEDYERVGKRKAYNFDGKREEVYAIFEQYKRWKKSCKRFDETDVVRHIFRRLGSVDSSSISVHQIYVDETQDFTEVELYLLIRLCQNPNDMFFTGKNKLLFPFFLLYALVITIVLIFMFFFCYKKYLKYGCHL